MNPSQPSLTSVCTFLALLVSIFCWSQAGLPKDTEVLIHEMIENQVAEVRQYEEKLEAAPTRAAKRKICLKLSRLYSIIDRPAGIKVLRQALEFTEPANDKERMQVLARLAVTFRRMGEMDSCASTLQKFESNFEETPTSAEYFITKATLEKYQGNFPQALDWLHEGVSWADSNGVFPQMIYGKLGELYMDRREYRKALQYFEKNLRHIKEQKAPVREDELVSMAECYSELGEIDQSKTVLALNETYNWDRAINKSSLAGLGNYITSRMKSAHLDGHYRECIQIATVATAIYSETSTPRQLGRILIVRADCYEKLGFFVEALRDLNQAEILVRKISNKARLIKVFLSRSKIYSSLGNHSYALRDLEAYHELYRDMHEGWAAEEISFLERELDRKEVNHKLQLLDKENRLKAMSLQKRKRLVWFLSMLLITLIILAIVLQHQLRYRKKAENEIRKSKELVEGSLREKEILLQEIHHRVKNNLQFISSLLSLQSEHMKDSTAVTALQEGQDRVRSMALIHQNLYQEHNLVGVDVREYFDKLIQNLFDSYNISPNRIKLQTKIQSMNIDVDTIIPLGLIVNELVSNALKYAFPDDRQGVIEVVLAKQDDSLHLTVRDNGIGIEKSLVQDLDQHFGYRLINAFCLQLDADLTIENKIGTTVSLEVKDFQTAA